MRKILWFAVLILLFLPGCHKRGSDDNLRQFADSLASMPPAEGLATCIARIKASPGEAGIIYHLAYYQAVNAGKTDLYASLLDSVGRLKVSEPSRLYISVHRALCSYVLSRPDLDSVTEAALSLPRSSDPTQEEVCAHMLACILTPTDAPRAYDQQMRAVQAMRHGGHWRSAEVLAQAAMLSCTLGNYPLGMNYLNEAYDTIEANGHPQREMVLYLGNKANLYSNVEMYDSALSANMEALKAAQSNDFLLTDVLNFRAFIFSDRGDTDSAFFYLDSAERVVNRLATPSAGIIRRYLRGRRAVLTVKSDSNPDALRRAVADLTECEAHNFTLWEERFMLANARWLLGDKGGLAQMASLRDSIAKYKEPALLLTANRHLINAYRDEGRLGDASRLYSETFALVDTLDLRHARYQSIASDLQHRVNTHQRENHLLKDAISKERERVFWLTMACVFGAALLVWSGIYLLLSHRLHNRRRAIDSHQITSLIENQKMLNRRLEEMQATGANTKDWSELTPSSMSAEDTARFRHSFSALYPDFLSHLRARCAGLTPGDENLCMLIRIGQSTDDIALALGISRASVNSARYRIRKKLGMGKDESLDNLINTL